MRALGAGTVIESRAPGFSPGDPVTGWFGWQEYAVVAPSAVVRKIAEPDLPLSTSLGILGINGATAHTALSIIGQPKQGETVVVSTAAGAVGSAAGQIANIHGRSEEHTSELQSLMRISYAVFCLKNKKKN